MTRGGNIEGGNRHQSLKSRKGIPGQVSAHQTSALSSFASLSAEEACASTSFPSGEKT